MKRVKDMHPDALVPVRETLGFAIGGMGGNFIVTLVSSFLLVYYTNVAGVSAATVALIMGVSKILDGISDLVAGYIIDHTHSKWGKCRPWQLRMIIPMIVCTFLMFYVPGGMKPVLQIIYIFVTYNLVNGVCMTMVSVSHAALNGSMSMNQKSRGINGGILMILAIISGIVLNSTVLQITTAVGKGNPYTQAGWTAMVLIFVAVYAILAFFGFAFTTERVTMYQRNNNMPVDVETNKEKRKHDVKVLEALKILLHDKYWVIFVITMICILYMQTSNGMSNVYFAQYVMGDVFYYTPLGNFQSVSALLAALITLVLIVKFKKRTICMTGLAFVAVGAFMPAISMNLVWIYVSAVLKGIGIGTCACVLPGMLQDSITYGQWKSGKDVLGMGNAGYSFANKLGASVGTILFGFLLQQGGFNGKLSVQPHSAITAINILFIWIPGIAMVLSMIAMSFYDLDKIYNKISTELKATMGVSENGEEQYE